MTSKELAALLDGNNYYSEITNEQETIAADSGLVVVFGYSDDNVELRGAIDDEVGAYGGTTFHVTRNGVLHTPDCGGAECEYFAIAKKRAAEIKAIWHDTGDACWTFETQIPHKTFRVYENGELFCIGIVFSAHDLPFAVKSYRLQERPDMLEVAHNDEKTVR